MAAMGQLAKHCPDDKVKPFGEMVGRLVWRLSKRYRNVALKNLRFVYSSEKTEDEIQDLAVAVFKHFGRLFVEFFWATRAGDKKIKSIIDISSSDAEPLISALESGRGAIVITGHFGNWELMARRLVIDGFPMTVVARDSDDPAQTGLVNKIRESGGYKVISREEPASKIMQVLKSNQLLGMLPDQNTIDKPIFVPFFGKLASTAPGVALLAIRTDCPIILGFAVRQGLRWKIEVTDTFYAPKEGDLRSKIYEVTAAYTKGIENEIRKYPEQWLWFHDRWRKRPPDEV